MPNLNDETVQVLWILAGCVAVIVCLPALLHLLGLTLLIARPSRDTSGLSSDTESESYLRTYLRLLDMGFEPLGRYRQYALFFLFHWLKTFHARVLFSPQHGCYAVVYRFVAGEEPVHVAFTSCSADDALIWTADSLEDLTIREADHIRTGLETSDLAELLDRHKDEVDDFVAGGRAVDAQADLAQLVRINRRISLRYMRRDKSLARGTLWAALVFFGTMPWLASQRHQVGLRWELVPLWMLAGGGIMLLMRMLLPLLMRQHRHQATAAGRKPHRVEEHS